MYDRYGSTAFDGNMGGQGSPFGGGFREFHFGGGMDDIFNSFFGGAAGGFDFGRGQDVETTVKIPYATAVLGGEILLRTPDGKIKCKINEGTQSGTRIRLKGKGKPAPGNPSVRGDMYITIEIQVPKNINQAAKEKLMEYQRLV
jgi:molecular chaperone DnaJ